MEHYEEMGVEGVTYKSLCWFCYMDDMSIIWPHGPSMLPRIPDHLKIQFTLETEGEGHLPFLDIDIYCKSEGSLGQKVYHKLTHINLYLNSNSHYHLYNKQAVLSRLVHRARSLCAQRSLHSELRITFRQNSYSNRQPQLLSCRT
jgi:hypothetical protein